MSSDTPTAAWHPAMMPNSAADIPLPPPQADIAESHEPSIPSQPTSEGAVDAAQPAVASPLRPIDASENHNAGIDEWFPDYEAGSPWRPNEEDSADRDQLQAQGTEIFETQAEAQLGPETAQEPEPESQHEQALVEEEKGHAGNPEAAEALDVAQGEKEETCQEAEAKSSTAPKHVSSDSFARTVSHQPIWMDDDEPEWLSPPRSGPDPFKFMPPNARTNSFPIVPPMEPPEQESVEPLPANQAEDVINEVEHQSESCEGNRGSSHAHSGLEQDNLWGDDDEDARFSAQLGGDIRGPDEEASDARYAEGMPLINHNQTEDTEEQGQHQTRDPFAEDTTADDDFFGQISGGANSSEQQDFVLSTLERKSTAQIMNGLGAAQLGGLGGMVDDTVVEEQEEELNNEQSETEQEVSSATHETSIATESATQQPQEGKGEDLVAKWSEAFAGDDDDDFLLEDEPEVENKDEKVLDPSAFFADDDEGFLEDVEEPLSQPAQQSTNPGQPAPPQPTSTGNKYLPVSAAHPGASRKPSNPYFPSASPVVPQAQTPIASVPPTVANPYASQQPQHSVAAPYGAPVPKPAINKAQSFADKAKGGYSSPYDLPMEVVKPRKRVSLQQSSRGATPGASQPPPPPRTSSMYGQGSPHMQAPPAQMPPPQGSPQMQRSGSGMSPPVSNHSGQSPSLPKPPQQLQSKPSFFEDLLPLSTKARPASRTSNKSHQSPTQAGLNPPPWGIHAPPSSMPTPHQEPSSGGQSVASDIQKLVPSAPVNPYAALPTGTNSAPPPVPPAASRYSPATLQSSMPNGAVLPPSRYSPAPPVQRPGLAGAGTISATAPAVLPHLPRTSSPLAHFEARPAASHGEPGLQTSRSSSSLHDPRLNRLSSLAPTREIEENAAMEQPAGIPLADVQSPPAPRQNEPPQLDSYGVKAMSPPKRKISYGPAPGGVDFVPPPRSQTSSPGAMYGLRSPIKSDEFVPRPSSAQGHPHAAIAGVVSTQNQAPVTSVRPRGMSQKLNMIPPTDGRENDPLERWKGVPLISWGIGGTLVTSFPVDVPRYGVNQPGPMIVRSPGEVKIKNVKDVQPLEDRLSKFPGPLRGKSKKKDTIGWLTSGIEELEKGLPNLAFQPNPSHEDKRAVERVLLWKILRIMIENDGALEGNETVDKAVREVLALAPTEKDGVSSPIYAGGNAFSGFAGESSATQMQADSVDSGTIQRLKKSLLSGDREKAVWDAADKRLWGHALLIANTVSPDLYHKVSREFIKKEVNFPGHNNESLAALYAVLSGNHDESMDELVPMHARAGVQMVASSTGPFNGGGLDGLEKWRETLTLILSNRSTGDVQALNSLGSLLSGYGRAEAAHICFLFGRSTAVFGGLDDPNVQFVLVGADHKTQSQQFFKETEALLLSEVYEYGLSLTGAPSVASGVPHFAVYKLQHAMTLAEHGFRDKAIQYCDIILKDMSAQTRRSPYHHILLESAVEDLRQRIFQAPNKEGSNSWISKPNMNKVSDTMWNRFNKFVAGDDADASGQRSPKMGDDAGPFARVAGGTPTISRPASASGATGMEMFGSPSGYAAGAPLLPPSASPVLSRTASRYAPATGQSVAAAIPYEPNQAYTPVGRSSMDRVLGENSQSPYEPRGSSDLPTSLNSSYIPSTSQSSYQPAPKTSGITTSTSHTTQISGPMTPSISSYTPFSQNTSPYAPVTSASNASPHTPAASADDGKSATGYGNYTPATGYQPLSYGYEPPTLHTSEGPTTETLDMEGSGGGYEPPSYQPYGFEPPSYKPGPEMKDEDEAKPKKKSFMDDHDDDFPSVSHTHEKSKSEKDKENEELFRKAAEEDAKRAEEEKAAKAKKGWGFGSWFGGGGAKKESLDSSSPNKPIRAKLGEKSSFVYDPEQKRWVNKAAGAEDTAPKTATPPPPMARSRPSAGTPPPPGPPTSAPLLRTGSAPSSTEEARPSLPGPSGSAPPPMMRSASNASSVGPGGPPSAPPSRPATSMSNASSIDDLLGAAVPRKGAASRGKKKGGGRYVDVMAK